MASSPYPHAQVPPPAQVLPSPHVPMSPPCPLILNPKGLFHWLCWFFLLKPFALFACFCNVFLQNTVMYTFVAIKPFQNTGFWHPKTLQFPYLPKPLETPLFTLFSSIFPCSNAAGQLKHIYQKSFKNIGFCSVFNALASKKHPRIVEQNRKHHLILVSVRNRFSPPPQLKLI